MKSRVYYISLSALVILIIGLIVYINKTNKLYTKDMKTPRNSISQLKAILDKGYNINKKNKHGMTLFQDACFSGHKEMVLFLLDKKNIDINQRSSNNSTALMYAIQPHLFAQPDNDNEIPLILIKRGADINAKDNRGRTALYCVSDGTLKVADCLINKGAKLDIKDNAGITPLQNAVYLKNMNIVALFLKNGAKINFINKEGKTALDIAKERQFNKIIDSLKQHGAKTAVELKSVGVSPK